MDNTDKEIRRVSDELHKMNTFLGHLCKVMDSLLLESDNTMKEAGVKIHPTGSDAVTSKWDYIPSDPESPPPGIIINDAAKGI